MGTTIELTLARFEEYGDRVAITVDDPAAPAEWTFRDVLDRARREARRLDELGVRHGDVVAIMAGTTPMGLIARWAANIVGAAFVSFADGYSASAVAALLTTCSARILVTDGSRRELADRAAALVAHPGVAAAGVYARTDGDGVETAAAAVVPLDGHAPSSAELIGWVTEHRGANVAPSEVRLVDDLPVTPSGKIDRNALRESAGQAS